MARSFAPFCSLLLVWLFALGAGPVRHAVAQSEVARSGLELVLRDVADQPLLAARAVAARLSSARIAERDAPAAHLVTPAAHQALATPSMAHTVRGTLALQDDAHRDRPRWRPYDATAPPDRSRIAR